MAICISLIKGLLIALSGKVYAMKSLSSCCVGEGPGIHNEEIPNNKSTPDFS